MTRYTIRQEEGELTIRVEDTGSKQDQDRLVAAFEECEQGRCDCPTDEYRKVAAFSVEAEGDEVITLRLTPRTGTRFDESEIDSCLRHTVAKTNP